MDTVSQLQPHKCYVKGSIAFPKSAGSVPHNVAQYVGCLIDRKMSCQHSSTTDTDIFSMATTNLY